MAMFTPFQRLPESLPDCLTTFKANHYRISEKKYLEVESRFNDEQDRQIKIRRICNELETAT
jgi:hypothetical protein